jgi:RPA family protein
MTDEDLDKLTGEIAGQIERLPEDASKAQSRAERKHRLVLQARREALGRIKAAREAHNFNHEAKASMDYALLTEYGEKNILLYNFMKARSGWWPRW